LATSGDTTWTLNRDQVLTGALRKLGVLASGGTPTTAQVNDASEALNALIKAFQADGMPVWKIASTTFTVTDGTSSYTIGPSGCTVTAVQPLKVIQALYTVSGAAQVPLNVYNRYDYNMLPVLSGTIEGNPVNLYYQPLSTTGVIKLWPTPDNSTTTITIHYQAPYEDMDTASNNFDFPAYWIQALIYNTAWALSPEYGIPPTDRNILAKEAMYWKEQALSYGSEEGSLYMQPDQQGR
jgi:hypothetical protein